MKNKVEECKSLHTSNAKSTLSVPQTFIKYKITKHENLGFFVPFRLVSSFYSITRKSKTIQCMRILCLPNIWSSNGDHSYLFCALCEVQLAS